MPGLANSRHAHPFRRPTRNSSANPTANLIATPAPTGGSDDTHIPHLLPPEPAASITASPSNTHHQPHPQPHPHHCSHSHRSAPHELARYTKIIRRLQWKLPFLAQGYRLAVDRLGADPSAVSEAELMFKLDFFEYYMLVERALVHLLGVFGVDIPRGSSHSPVRTEGGEAAGQERQGQQQQQQQGHGGKGLAGSLWRDGRDGRHRYHANVLAALDREENPLHGTLGTGEVRVQLGRAKDLRNRWKTAGDEEAGGHGGQNHNRSPTRRDGGDGDAGASAEKEWGRTRKIAAPLDSYRLEHLLEVIFQGFDEAFKVAEAYVRSGEKSGAAGDADMLGEDGRVMDWTAIGDEEEQWEFMVDAMDWEAV